MLVDVSQRLIDTLGGAGKVPPARGFKFFDHAKAGVDNSGKIVVRRSDLHGIDDFENRFAELSSKHPPWINVSCYGLFEGDIIVGIELPRAGASEAKQTSVNYSGPPKVVVENAWDATRAVSIL